MANSFVVLRGNLTKDPDLRFLQSGAAVCRFRVGVNDRRFDKTTQAWVEELSGFFDVEAWNGLAESIAEAFSKGDRIAIEGQLREQTWEKDGESRSKVVVRADVIHARQIFPTKQAPVVKEAERHLATVAAEEPY